MKFKYIRDFDKLIGLSEKRRCKLCEQVSICFDERCKKCYDNLESLKKTPEEFKFLYTRARPEEIRKQLKESNPEWSDDKIENIARKRDNEIEYGTPTLNGYQEFQWPCFDGDYCELIAYGCKPYYNKLSKKNNGKDFFDNSLHYEIKEYYVSDNWNEYWEDYVPDEMIETVDDANYGTLYYIFKSLYSEKIITYVDSM